MKSRRTPPARRHLKVIERLELRLLLSLESPLFEPMATSTAEPPAEALEALLGDGGGAKSGTYAFLADVPEYFWYHGCGPTSGGMVMGYWDRIYPNLFAGDAGTQTAAVDDGIASPLHIRDYVPTPDPGTTHTDDCLADFMLTSRGTARHGWGKLSNFDDGMRNYADFRGYDYSESYNVTYSSMDFADLQAEIDAERPLVALVDSDGSGDTDHWIPIIGYRTSPNDQFAAFTTWSGSPGVQWFDWIPMASGDPFGVYAVTYFRPSATRPDLAPGYSNVAPEPLLWGDSFTYNYRVENYGGVASAASTVRFYLSADETISTSDFLLNSASVAPISPYSSQSGNLALMLPNTRPTGFTAEDTVYIGMLLDPSNAIAEGAEDNNAGLGEDIGYDVVNVGTKPDLVGTSFSLDMPMLNFGETRATFTIANQGTTDAGAFTVRLFLSSNDLISSADTFLVDTTISVLPGGATFTRSMDVTVPTTPPTAGDNTWTIGMMVDYGDAIDEASNTNNYNRGMGLDKASAIYGEKIFNATFDNGDGAMQIENDTPAWAPVDGLWHRTSYGSIAPLTNYKMYYGVDKTGNYDVGDSAGYFQTKIIQLPDGPSALSFDYKADVDSGATTDAMSVHVYDVAAGTYTMILDKGPGLWWYTSGTFDEATADLSAFAGRQVRLCWKFDTGGTTDNEDLGWMVDNIAVWSLQNAATVDGFRCLRYDANYTHTASYVSYAGDHDTFVFNEEQLDGTFALQTISGAGIRAGIAVYDRPTGRMLYIDSAAASGGEAALTLINSGRWNTYLVEVWDVEEDSTGNLDVSIDGPGSSYQTVMTVFATGHAERLDESIANDTDTDFYRVTAPTDASGTLDIVVTPHDDATMVPRLQVWKNLASDVPDRIIQSSIDEVRATFTGVLPGDTFYISVADNDFSGTGPYDLAADFSTALPATLTAGEAEGFAYFNDAGNCLDALSQSALISPLSDVDSYVFAGDRGWAGTYTIRAEPDSGSDATPVIAVYNGTTGARLAVAGAVGGVAELTLDLAELTEYVIAVADDDEADMGAIDITIDAPGTSTATTVALDGAGDGYRVGQTLSDNDTDFFTFKAPADATGAATIRVAPSAGLDAAFALFYPAGTMRAERSSVGAGAEETMNLTGLVAGYTYTVAVMADKHASIGTFGLYVDFETVTPGSIDPADADWDWEPNQLGSEHILANLAASEDYEIWAIRPEAAGAVDIAVASSSYPAAIALYDSAGVKLAAAVAGGTGATAALTYDGTGAAIYYVYVGSRSGTDHGGYTMDIQTPPFPMAGSIGVDPEGAGSIGSSASPLADQDFFTLVAPAGAYSVSVTMAPSAALRPSLRMYDTAGAKLAGTSSTSPGSTIDFSETVVAGQTYVIGASGENLAIGSYTIDVQFKITPGIVSGTADANDFYVRIDPADTTKVQVFVDQLLTETPMFFWTLATLPRLEIHGLAGDDSLTVDMKGNPVPTGGLHFYGDEGSDEIEVKGANAPQGKYLPDKSVAGAGVIEVASSTITFTGLEPVTVSAFRDFVLETPNGQDDLLIDLPSAGHNRISGTSGKVLMESLTFSDIRTLILDLASEEGGGDDDVTIGAAGIVGASLLKLNVGKGDNTLALLGGGATVDSNLGTDLGRYLSIAALGASQLVFPESQTLRTLTLGDTAKTTLAGGRARPMWLDDLVIKDSGTLDLVDNDLVVQATTLTRAEVRDQLEKWIAKGRNTSPLWKGTGIISSAARTDPLRGLAVAINIEDGYRLWPDFSDIDILVKHTWDGDTNLDGMIDGDDYLPMDRGFLAAIPLPSYHDGDIDFDEDVDGDDYFLIDQALLGQTGILAPASGVRTEPQAAAAVVAGTFSAGRRIAESLVADAALPAPLPKAGLFAADGAGEVWD